MMKTPLTGKKRRQWELSCNGYLPEDPHYRTTKSGKHMVWFDLIYNERPDEKGVKQKESHTFRAFGSLALHIAENYHKRDFLEVVRATRSLNWKDKNGKVYPYWYVTALAEDYDDGAEPEEITGGDSDDLPY
jgi:single-stranded DNA-binding protein